MAAALLDKLNDVLKFKLAFLLGKADTSLELICYKFAERHFAIQLTEEVVFYAIRKLINDAVKGKVSQFYTDAYSRNYVIDVLKQVCDVDRSAVAMILGLTETYLIRLKKTGSRMSSRLYLEAELVSDQIWDNIPYKDICSTIGSKKTIHAKLVISLLHTFRHMYSDAEITNSIIPNPNIDSLLNFITSPIFDLIVLA